MYETSAKAPEISFQLNRFLSIISRFLESNIQQAQIQNTINKELSPALLSSLITSQVQGAYLLSRATNNDGLLQEQLTFLQLFIFKD